MTCLPVHPHVSPPCPAPRISAADGRRLWRAARRLGPAPGGASRDGSLALTAPGRGGGRKIQRQRYAVPAAVMRRLEAGHPQPM